MPTTKRTNKKPGVIFVRRRRGWDRRSHDHAREAPSLRGAFATKQSSLCAADPGLLRLRLAMTKRIAERRKALLRNLRISRCGTRPCGRARLSAFHHGTCSSDRTPPLSSSHATSWDLFGAPVPMVRKTHASHRAVRDTAGPNVTRGHYPRLKVPVQRDCTRRPVVMPVGRVLPKPPGSRSDEPRPAGTALAPPTGVTRPASLYVSEIRRLYPIV